MSECTEHIDQEVVFDVISHWPVPDFKSDE